jgi:hypothetical protein
VHTYLPLARGAKAARQCAAATMRTSLTPKPMWGAAGQKSPCVYVNQDTIKGSRSELSMTAVCCLQPYGPG